MSKQIHITRVNELINTVGYQLRGDDPSLPQDQFEGSIWFNDAQKLFKARINGIVKTFPFDAAGQSLYSTVVSSASELAATISAGTADTIYLRAGTYNLMSVASPGLVIQKPLRLIGEKTRGGSGSKVQIITDSTHILAAAPTSTTITNNNTVSVTNGSNVVNLVGGTWATNLIGQYLFIDGVPYLIATNPNPGQITLVRNFTGVSSASRGYFIAAMLDGVSIENIEFLASTSTHQAVILQNVLRPIITNCTFTSPDTIYGKVLLQVTYQGLFAFNDLLNYKVDILSDNYNGFAVNNNFVTSALMGTDAAIALDTGKGVSSINTYFTIAYNNHTGPGSFLRIAAACSNEITGNNGNSTSNLWMSIDSNSHNNIVTENRPIAISGGDVLIRVNSSGNIVNSNRLSKQTGFALDLTATANHNTVIGNIIDGGATINDTVSANVNRVEDDLQRIGNIPTGYTKDLIDEINNIIVTLQNVPKALILQRVAVNSGVATESPVFWNSNANEYQLASTEVLGAAPNAIVGVIKKTGSNSGDVHIQGIVSFANSGNAMISGLFNSGLIGQNFYLGVSGQLVPESLLFSSGVPTNPIVVGRLIDVTGGTTPQFFINEVENQKYGTPINQWYLGQNSTAQKSLIARTVSGDSAALTYDPPTRRWYVVNGSNSGEIVQPLNQKISNNSVLDYESGVLVSYGSGSLQVNPHRMYNEGYRRDGGQSTLSPVSTVSGDVFVFDHHDSGVILTTSWTSGVLLGTIYNSGNIFLTDQIAQTFMNRAAQHQQPDLITPVDTTYTQLARVYLPFRSGTIDFHVEARATGYTQLQAVAPFQVGRIKLQLNGTDIVGTEMASSFYFVSGQVLYESLHTNALATAFSTSGTMHVVTLMGRYEQASPTTPVTFSGVNLILRGL